MHKKGFSLSEVLITLGVIGVVSALTMPTLIANYQKKQTVTKLQKFYTVMSQALLRWEADEGLSPDDVRFKVTEDEDGNKNLVSDFETWYNENLDKYLSSVSKSTKTKYFEENDKLESRYTIALNDGSGFLGYIASENVIYIFYCTDFKYCAPESFDGKRTFLFQIFKGKLLTGSSSSADRTYILNTCKRAEKGHCHQCARLIQLDGWQIKDDYPW